MTELQVPSNRRSPIGGIEDVDNLWVVTKIGSIKQWDDPESISVFTKRCSEMVSIIKRESGSERVAALRCTDVTTWSRSMQSSAREASRGLQTIFLIP
jgi:hypothetical protein